MGDRPGYYLAHDSELSMIAARGRERTLRGHSFERRLKLLIDSVLGDTNSYPIDEFEVVRR